MANTTMEYIGARYVPLIIGPWDSSIDYEPLSIVLNNGNSYTSRRYTPAGTPLTNNEYWALTGEFNAQVAQYRTEVQTLAGRFDDIEDTVETANNDAAWARQEAQNARTTANNAYTLADNVQTALDNTNVIVNRLNSIYIMPESWGAVGDGVTDDTAAFKQMFDDMPDYSVIMLSNKTYLITDALAITKRYITITTPFKGEYSPTLKFTGTSYTQCLTVHTQGLGMYGISIDGDIYSGSSAEKKLLVLNGNAVNGNIDASIQNCTFIHMSHGIVIQGRNVWIDGCLFSQCIYTAGDRAAVLVDQMQVNTSRRGVFIENCRFHGVTVSVRNNITSYDEVHSLAIQNSYFDMCSYLYLGMCDGVVINNNRFIQTSGSGTVIGLSRVIQNDTAISICNNIIVSTASGNPFRTAIDISESVSGRIKIIGNMFYTSYTSGTVVNFLNDASANGNVYFMFNDNYIESNTNGYGLAIAANNSNKAFIGMVANNILYIPNGTPKNTFPVTVQELNTMII